MRRLHLLHEFYQTIIVPQAVWQEVTAAAGSLPGAKEALEASQEGWLTVQSDRVVVRIATGGLIVTA